MYKYLYKNINLLIKLKNILYFFPYLLISSPVGGMHFMFYSASNLLDSDFMGFLYYHIMLTLIFNLKFQ